MKITYGILDKNIDVTEICIHKLMKNNIITIPASDFIRTTHFTDPIIGTLKQIFITDENGTTIKYDDNLVVKIDTINNIINTIDITDSNTKLSDIQQKLKLSYGSFNEELPEQKMACRYLTGNEKVLEIGGNIGRNSLIIGAILGENNNFVSLECDPTIANQLRENRDLNNMTFHIESSALSKRKLIQRGWDTIVSDELLSGYQWVNTMTLDQLSAKYNIPFDTLVLDCEGAFYYILMDMPEILNNINLIIMENDYWDYSKKEYIDKILTENNFYVDYVEGGGWGPCYHNFFEVWKKK
jgi:FkbM family methyltransferase